jgi:hypothetical protein
MTVLGAAPLLAGAVVPVSAVSGDGVVCPFRLVTGLPCPLCGATRAFVHAGHLDGSWVDYGAVWVVAAVALVLGGLLWRGRPAPPGRVVALVAVAVSVAAWAWALAHTATIT